MRGFDSSGAGDLAARMQEAHVDEKDIDENFVQSPKKGGQNVNKVATCVCLVHRPTGIRVKCHRRRTQYMNRVAARRILVHKILAERRQYERQRDAQKARQRRLKAKRPQKVKEKILASKRHRSEKKDLRRKITARPIELF